MWGEQEWEGRGSFTFAPLPLPLPLPSPSASFSHTRQKVPSLHEAVGRALDKPLMAHPEREIPTDVAAKEDI